MWKLIFAITRYRGPAGGVLGTVMAVTLLVIGLAWAKPVELDCSQIDKDSSVDKILFCIWFRVGGSEENPSSITSHDDVTLQLPLNSIHDASSANIASRQVRDRPGLQFDTISSLCDALSHNKCMLVLEFLLSHTDTRPPSREKRNAVENEVVKMRLTKEERELLFKYYQWKRKHGKGRFIGRWGRDVTAIESHDDPSITNKNEEHTRTKRSTKDDMNKADYLNSMQKRKEEFLKSRQKEKEAYLRAQKVKRAEYIRRQRQQKMANMIGLVKKVSGNLTAQDKKILQALMKQKQLLRRYMALRKAKSGGKHLGRWG